MERRVSGSRGRVSNDAGWPKVREHRSRRRLLCSWRAAWLILDRARRTSTF